MGYKKKKYIKKHQIADSNSKNFCWFSIYFLFFCTGQFDTSYLQAHSPSSSYKGQASSQ